MNKFILLIALFLFISCISGIEVEIKEEYSIGETLIGKISGNLISPLKEDNIYLYREHQRIPINPKVLRINNDYYFYFNLDLDPRNYSLIIKDIEYFIGVQTSDKDINKQIKILNKTADFRIDHGAFYVEDFFSIRFLGISPSMINIDNLDRNLGGANGEIKPLSEFPFQLTSGENKRVYFTLHNFTEPRIKRIKLFSSNTEYIIPVFVSKESLINEKNNTEEFNYTNESNYTSPTNESNYTSPTNETYPEENKSFKEFSFNPLEINISLKANSSSEDYFIYLNNTGTEDIENISFIISKTLEREIEFYEGFLDKLPKDSFAKIRFKVIPSKTEKISQGYIFAETPEGLYNYSRINLEFFYNESKLETNIPNQTYITPIPEPNGEEDDSKLKEIIGWILLGLVIVFVAWFYFKKYKGTKNTPKFPR